MLGEELGLKDYPHVPGILLGLKDHLQVARTTAQSSLKLLLAAVILLFVFSSMWMYPSFQEKQYFKRYKVCVRHYKRHLFPVLFISELLIVSVRLPSVEFIARSSRVGVCVCMGGESHTAAVSVCAYVGDTHRLSHSTQGHIV